MLSVSSLLRRTKGGPGWRARAVGAGASEMRWQAENIGWGPSTNL